VHGDREAIGRAGGVREGVLRSARREWHVAELFELLEPLAAVLMGVALVLGWGIWLAPPVAEIERGEAKGSWLPVISMALAVLCIVVTLMKFPTTRPRDIDREIALVPYATLGLIFSWYALRASGREMLRWFGAVLFLGAGILAWLMIDDICRAAART
jgi:hypothetical protein